MTIEIYNPNQNIINNTINNFINNDSIKAGKISNNSGIGNSIQNVSKHNNKNQYHL